MFSFNMLFFAFFLNPHWISRLIAARSDATVKNVIALMAFQGIWTTLPMLVVGIVAAANLKNLAAPGTSAFALFIDELFRHEGAPRFFGTIAACSAIAAIMSTVDSALIAITNIFSKDWLEHVLYFYWPETRELAIGDKKHGFTFNNIVLKLFSAGVLILAVTWANGIEGASLGHDLSQ